MCGRYVRKGSKQKIAEYFRANPNPAELPMPDADYNIAPIAHQPIIRQSRETGEREIVLARWGLVPFFTKDLKEVKGLSTINAHAETTAKAPTWREPFKKRRCIIPAHAFFEREKADKPPKNPYVFEHAKASHRLRCLWDAWKDKEGHWLQSRRIDGDFRRSGTFGGSHLAQLDVKEADRIGAELRPLGLVPIH